MDFLFTVQRTILTAVPDDLGAFATSGDWPVLLAVMPVGGLFEGLGSAWCMLRQAQHEVLSQCQEDSTSP
jgi:hypothetical protein